jgi:hypothetical protein
MGSIRQSGPVVPDDTLRSCTAERALCLGLGESFRELSTFTGDEHIARNIEIEPNLHRKNVPRSTRPSSWMVKGGGSLQSGLRSTIGISPCRAMMALGLHAGRFANASKASDCSTRSGGSQSKRAIRVHVRKLGQPTHTFARLPRNQTPVST